MVHANGKITQKYSKLIRWPKITFRGPNLVPEVSFWGFWGLVYIEKWSSNFDSGTRSAIFGTLKMTVFAILRVPKMALRVPESKF